MKIAIYQPRASYYQGGGEVVPLEHAKLLQQLGHDVSLVTARADFIQQSDSFIDFQKTSRVTIHYIDVPTEFKWIYDQEPGINWSRWDIESLHVGRLAYEFFLNHPFELVACHNLFDGIAVPRSRLSIMHLHGTPKAFEPHHAYLATLPDQFVAVSQSVAEGWSGLTKKLPKVVTNGIDTVRFKPAVVIPEYDLLYVGRLLPVKGVDTVLNSLAILKNDYGLRPDLAIGGSGPYEKHLKKMTGELDLKDQVHFLGYIDNESMPGLYGRAGISIFPSKSKEGVLTTILEAASCRRPIITTKVGGIPEFIKNRQNGILVGPEDPGQLANAINTLLENQTLRDKIAESARSDVLSHWSWNAKIKELEDFYESAINEGK